MAEEVGIRAFKDHVSGYVERVERGEVVTVTRDGEPVARLVPAWLPTGVSRLLSEGRLRWTGARPPLPSAVELYGDGPTASEYVAEGRR